MALALTATAVTAGQQANDIEIVYVPLTDATLVTVALTTSNFGQQIITITAGYSIITGFLNVADWTVIAAALNADGSIAAIITSVGTANNTGQLTSNIIQLVGGTAGGSAGAYFFGVAAPAPAPATNTTGQGAGTGTGFAPCPGMARGRVIRRYLPWRAKKRKDC